MPFDILLGLLSFNKGWHKVAYTIGFGDSHSGVYFIHQCFRSRCKCLDFVSFEANSFYVMDRGYVDYKRLYKIDLCDAFFVTRAKDNMNCRRLYSHPKDIEHGILYDQTIMLNNYYSSLDYPQKMRRIKFIDEDSEKILIFLTNNFKVPAIDIAILYKYRWGIELFFEMDKTTSKNKIFLGPK